MPGTRLASYRSKRDFRQKTEPRGTLPVAKSQRLRFVIQKHAARRLHYDLRLELGGVFKSWAVTRGPSLDPADKRLAVQVEDHPLDYGDFEGTIARGQYGGGTVQLWDRGYWRPLPGTSPEAALKAGQLKFDYSRDHRFDCVQVVIALIITPQGFPLAYEVLAGNTADNTTLKDFLARIEHQYGKAR